VVARLNREARISTMAAVVATMAATLAVLSLLGCRQANEIPEDGSVMLRINAAPTGSRPTELRVWVYADEGVIFDGTRFPAQGNLPATVGSILGSILVSPGNVSGNLRIYVRGLENALTVATGTVVLPPAMRNRTTVDVFLDHLSLRDVDTDGDGVPDEIDDCPTVSNPQQLGCPQGAGDDAGTGGTTTPIDASGSGGTGGGTGGGLVPGGTGGSPRGSGGSGASGGTQVGDAGADHPTLVDAQAGDATADPADASARTDAEPLDAAGPGSPVDAGGGQPDVIIPFGKGLGSTCRTNLECRSLFCADGVCCNAACDQPCRACFFGYCLAISRAPDVPQCSGTVTCNQSAMCVPVN
jgi:uncharacterized membrane protein YgcG